MFLMIFIGGEEIYQDEVDEVRSTPIFQLLPMYVYYNIN